MDIDRMKELIAQREAIDEELTAIVIGSAPKEKKTLTCSKCGEQGHTARTCKKGAVNGDV